LHTARKYDSMLTLPLVAEKINRRILIIDDETDFCMIMKNYFVKKGYEVEFSPTLREGMALLKEIRPDILFLDNNLPDGNGWDSVEQVVEIIPQARVYLVSAHRDRSTVETKSKNIVIWEKPISLQILNDLF
jgi:two-component SAPR family response regulator